MVTIWYAYQKRSPASCIAITRAGQALAVLQYFPWAGNVQPLHRCSFQLTSFLAFSALRAFALSGRHWHASLLVLILSLVPIGLNLVRRFRRRLTNFSYFSYCSTQSQFYWLAAVNDPKSGCAAELTVPIELSRM